MKKALRIPNLWNRCQIAASLLDKEVPNWHTKVDSKKLDFSIFWSSFRGCGCVSGQYARNSGFTVPNDKLHDIIVHNERRRYGLITFEDESIVFAERCGEHHKKLIRYWTTLINQRR